MPNVRVLTPRHTVYGKNTSKLNQRWSHYPLKKEAVRKEEYF